jgi:HAE1 family hydrophobic/amphiphilic exporter-1
VGRDPGGDAREHRVFLPVVFIKEEAGQLFQDISIAISISLLLYLFVSPTVIPVLATLFLRKMPGGFVEGSGGEEAHEEKINTGLGRITAPIGRAAGAMSKAFYELTLWLTHGVVRRLALILVMVVIALAGSWYLIPPRTYLPSGNQNLVFAFVLAPPGYSIAEFRAMGEHVERTLRPWWEVGTEEGDTPQVIAEKKQKLAKLEADWRTTRDTMIVPAMEQQLAGMKASMPPDAFADASKQMVAELEQLKRSPAPAGIDNFFFVTFEGNVFMGATSIDGENVASLKYIFQSAAQGIPGSFTFPLQATIFDLGDSFGSSLDVNISGPDYDKVRAAAGMAQGMIMQKMNAFALPNPQNFNIGRAETRVVPDRPRAAAAGVDTKSIRRAALVAVDGEIIGDYREGAKSIDLTVMSINGSPVDQTRMTEADALRDIPLATRGGMTVPLSAVANLVPSEARSASAGSKEQPAVTLSIQIPSNLTVQEAQTALFESVIAPLREQGRDHERHGRPRLRARPTSSRTSRRPSSRLPAAGGKSSCPSPACRSACSAWRR